MTKLGKKPVLKVVSSSQENKSDETSPILEADRNTRADSASAEQMLNQFGKHTDHQTSTQSTTTQQKVEALYNLYRNSLFNYLQSICAGGREEALEILQETYIRLLRLNDLTHLELNPRAYLFTIATNLSRDAMRKRVSRKLDVHDEFDELEFYSDEPTPSEILDWDSSMRRLKEVMVVLPDTTRTIFLLSRFEELSYSQIASQLNISTRTVERHMRNAMEIMLHTFEDIL